MSYNVGWTYVANKFGLQRDFHSTLLFYGRGVQSAGRSIEVRKSVFYLKLFVFAYQKQYGAINIFKCQFKWSLRVLHMIT